MRLFIAIELPDDLKTALGRLRIDISGARWVPEEQLHLTLAFLGEVEETAVGRLTETLAQIHLPGFKLGFSDTGCFPSRRRPRVAWIGLEPHVLLNRLAAKVREAVLVCGIPLEERPFSPHITLARLKISEAGTIDVFLDRSEKMKPAPFYVQAFTLFQSRLAPQGAVHIPLKSFPLAPAGNLST